MLLLSLLLYLLQHVHTKRTFHSSSPKIGKQTLNGTVSVTTIIIITIIILIILITHHHYHYSYYSQTHLECLTSLQLTSSTGPVCDWMAFGVTVPFCNTSQQRTCQGDNNISGIFQFFFYSFFVVVIIIILLLFFLILTYIFFFYCNYIYKFIINFLNFNIHFIFLLYNNKFI